MLSYVTSVGSSAMGQHCLTGHSSSAQMWPDEFQGNLCSTARLQQSWKLATCGRQQLALSQNRTFRNKAWLKRRMSEGKARQEWPKRNKKRRSQKEKLEINLTNKWDLEFTELFVFSALTKLVQCCNLGNFLTFFSHILYQVVSKKREKIVHRNRLNINKIL